MKKITNFLLTSALCLTALVGTASATSFSDVPTSAWYHSYVTSAVNSGFMSGTGNGNFSPETSMTYGQFAVVIVNGAFDGKTTGASGTHWADVYLNTLSDKGLLQSATGTAIVSQTSGWQDQAITREDAASIIVRVMGQVDASIKANIVGALADTAINAFSDVGSTQKTNGQADDIAMVMANNIMIGSNGEFGVGTSVKRSDACVVFSTLQSKNIFTATTPSTPSTGTTPSTSPNSFQMSTLKSTTANGLSGEESRNLFYHEYSKLSSAVKSNLVEATNGYIRVEIMSTGGILVEEYNKAFQLVSSKNIPTELTQFVCFYEGSEYFFLMFSATNLKEDDSVEVVRVVKYSKDWVRIDSASYFGAFVNSGVDAADMAELDGNLLIHSRRTIYKSADGLNHQSNFRLTVDIDTMTPVTQYHGSGGMGYSSHSFNQLIAVSPEGFAITADHGDAHPRAMLLTYYPGPTLLGGILVDSEFVK